MLCLLQERNTPGASDKPTTRNFPQGTQYKNLANAEAAAGATAGAAVQVVTVCDEDRDGVERFA